MKQARHARALTWRDKRLMAVSQAGLVEKFVDTSVWVFYAVLLFRHGVSDRNIGLLSEETLVWLAAARR